MRAGKAAPKSGKQPTLWRIPFSQRGGLPGDNPDDLYRAQRDLELPSLFRISNSRRLLERSSYRSTKKERASCVSRSRGIQPFSDRLMSAMVFHWRCLGPRRFTERFDRNALVTHFQDHQVFPAARGFESDVVPRCRLEQRAPQRRHPTDMVAVQVDLVGALFSTMLTTRSVPVALANRTVAPKNARVAACPALGRSGSTTSAASIRFVRKRIRPSI